MKNISTIIAQSIIEKSKATFTARNKSGSKASGHSNKLIQSVFGDPNQPRPFGCMTEEVATLIEGLTGEKVKLQGEAARKFGAFDVYQGEGTLYLGLAECQIGQSVALWSPKTPEDTYTLGVGTTVKPFDGKLSAVSAGLYAKINKNPAVFVKAIRSRISIDTLV